jgi:hypothetical protein
MFCSKTNSNPIYHQIFVSYVANNGNYYVYSDKN